MSTTDNTTMTNNSTMIDNSTMTDNSTTNNSETFTTDNKTIIELLNAIINFNESIIVLQACLNSNAYPALSAFATSSVDAVNPNA